ncbi:hypothetical protein IKQ26_05085 [bacterium]|nr:hypothetical protein [bacterium]
MEYKGFDNNEDDMFSSEYGYIFDEEKILEEIENGEIEEEPKDEQLKRRERLEELKTKLKAHFENDETRLNKIYDLINFTEKSTELVRNHYKELSMEYNKFIDKYFDPNNKMGFNEVLFARQEKINALRERLKQYYLTDEELDHLFKIIEQAEMDMEKVKRRFNGKNYDHADMMKLQKDLVLIQKKMKDDFEKKLSDTIKAKYEKAKKIKEEMDKHKQQHQEG